jgi:hypothetical protein
MRTTILACVLAPQGDRAEKSGPAERFTPPRHRTGKALQHQQPTPARAGLSCSLLKTAAERANDRD